MLKSQNNLLFFRQRLLHEEYWRLTFSEQFDAALSLWIWNYVNCIFFKPSLLWPQSSIFFIPVFISYYHSFKQIHGCWKILNELQLMFHYVVPLTKLRFLIFQVRCFRWIWEKKRYYLENVAVHTDFMSKTNQIFNTFDNKI